MPRFLRAADRPPSASRTIRFEGGAHGTGQSFFAVDIDAGQRVGLHVHPYAETWLVQEGTATFQLGDNRLGQSRITAGPGDILVVEPGLPHGFTNTGDGRLVMMCLHDGPEIVQTFLDPDDA